MFRIRLGLVPAFDPKVYGKFFSILLYEILYWQSSYDAPDLHVTNF